MRFSPRSKVGILLSAITILTLVGAFMVTLVSHGAATHAATSSGIGSYKGTPIKGQVLATNTNFLSSGKTTAATAQQKDPRYFPYHSPARQNGGVVKTATHGVPQVSSSALSEGALKSNFDGLNDAQNKIVAGFHEIGR